MRRRLMVATPVVFAALMALPVHAQAGTIVAKTTNGKRCTVQTITERSRFGLTVAPCVAKRASGFSYLYDEDGEPLHTIYPTPATNTRLPYSNVGTAPVEGEQVVVQFALFLKKQRHRRDKFKVKWRPKSGGDLCHRRGPTVLSCKVVVRFPSAGGDPAAPPPGPLPTLPLP